MPDIDVKGTIVSNDDKWIYDWCGFDATCPRDIQKSLGDANGQEITVRVNSGGGDVFAGNEIYYLLDAYKGNVLVDITGYAASAATIVCCAGDKVRATPGTLYMIHNVSCGSYGDYNTMDKASEILKSANKSISNVYQMKTGKSEKELLDLMNKETWMDAEKAKSYGFIDEIIGDNGTFTKPVTITNSAATILNDEVKEKIRNMIKSPNGQQKTDSDFLIQQENLNLLKLRGERRYV